MPVDRQLDPAIDDILKRHPLRGFDSIHLASALIFKNDDAEDVLFAGFDAMLNNARKKRAGKNIDLFRIVYVLNLFLLYLQMDS